jgi:xylulokinase
MSGLLLGVDVGTSSTKDVLARPDGGIVATAQREHGLSTLRLRCTSLVVISRQS